MAISQEYVGKSGVKYIFEYEDADSFERLPKGICKQCWAVCFLGDQMVIAYAANKQTWGLVGGTIEKGESFEETLKREIKEESNMEVLRYLPLGYQKVTDTRDGKVIYQLRFVCTVQPYGDFLSDPAGIVTEIKLIDPKEYTRYFNWGKISDRIVERALDLKKKLI